MKRITQYIILAFAISPFMLLSQTATEAYRLSISDPVGTARNLGVGNSMFAIGPDFSAIGSNPAGLGGYGKSEFLVTSSFTTSTYSSAFRDDRLNETNGYFDKFTLPNIGVIFYTRPQHSKWNSSNWSIGMNRTSDYCQELRYTGNTLGSMTDSWKENAAGTSPDNLNGFEEGLAYTTGAIYDFENDNIYETDYNLNPEYALRKYESVFIEGGKDELFFAYGADYDQKILFGFSLGMPFVNSTQSRYYNEDDGIDNGVPYFNSLEYYSFIHTSGYGWNGKFGIIIKPVKQVNIAVAFHTPTKLFLIDHYNTTLSYDYTDDEHNGPIFSGSPYGTFNYALRTPWSGTAGIGIIAGKSGFISASAKFTDYSSMRYDYSVNGNGHYYDQIEHEVNDNIITKYNSALQLNMGGEIVIDKLRFRGGASMQQSPYRNDQTFSPSYHAGFGYREDHYYIDLAYVLTKQEDGYLPYETNDAPPPLVVTDFYHHRITATLGFKF